MVAERHDPKATDVNPDSASWNYEFLPGISGVSEVVVSRASDGELTSAAEGDAGNGGLKTVRCVHLSMTELEPFERTAVLLAYLLVPGKAAHKERTKIYRAICYLAARSGLAWPKQRRAYVFQDEAHISSTTKRIRRLFRHRTAAALMALPFVLARGLDGVALPLRHELAEETAYWADESDLKNVQYRVWSASFPVIHLAVAVLTMRFGHDAEFLRLLTQGGSADHVLALATMYDLEFLSFLARDDAADRLLELAESCERHIRVAPTLSGVWPRLIRFTGD